MNFIITSRRWKKFFIYLFTFFYIKRVVFHNARLAFGDNVKNKCKYIGGKEKEENQKSVTNLRQQYVSNALTLRIQNDFENFILFDLLIGNWLANRVLGKHV